MEDIKKPLAPGRKIKKAVASNLVRNGNNNDDNLQDVVGNSNELEPVSSNTSKSFEQNLEKNDTKTSSQIDLIDFSEFVNNDFQNNIDVEIVSAELDEKRRLAEEKRKKRAMFLSSVDNFSQNFEEKVQDNELRLQGDDSDLKILTKSIKETSLKYNVPNTSIIQDDSNLFVKKSSYVDPPKKVIVKISEIENDETQTNKFTVNSSSDFNKLSSNLFSNTISNTDINQSDFLSQDVDEGNLSVPSKIGNSEKLKSSSNNLTYATFDDDFGSDEEGTGDVNNPKFSHFLTREERLGLSAEQKVAWKALQGDLTSKRKDFHGAVTYAFDGIFSWQMYGSAEAVDEMGKEYTEYLMRCQWGTTWDNLQPWIAARRYREFDRLDAELKKKYPNLSHTMPKLPEKDYFRFLEADVISKRRKTIQEYMSAIVSTMPTILKSPIMDEFLGISERINTLKSQLKVENDNQILSADQSDKIPKFIPPGVETELGKDDTDISSIENTKLQDQSVKEVDEFSILTSEDAENFKIANKCKPMDEDSLGSLEEDIQLLVSLMSKAGIKDVGRSGQIRKILISCTNQWPSLRATCEFGNGVDFALIPRSMQAEEDLIHCLNDYKRTLFSKSFAMPIPSDDSSNHGDMLIDELLQTHESDGDDDNQSVNLEELLKEEDDDIVYQKLISNDISEIVLSSSSQNYHDSKENYTFNYNNFDHDKFTDEENLLSYESYNLNDDNFDNYQLSALNMADQRESTYISFGKTEIIPILQSSKVSINNSVNIGIASVYIEKLALMSIQLQKYIDYKSNGPGLPTCIFANSKYLAIGTSRGYILLFDHNQEVRQVLVTSNNSGSTSYVSTAITALDIHSNNNYLVCGLSTGSVNLWDISRSAIVKSLSNCHDSRIVKLHIISSIAESSTIKISSTNIESNPSEVTIISVDSKGTVNRIRFTKLLWTSYTSETDCLLDGSSGSICDMKCCPSINDLPLFFERSEYSDNYVIKIMHPHQNKLAALSTKGKTYIIQVYPLIRVLFRWPVIDNIKKIEGISLVISLDWGFKLFGNKDDRKVEPVLFRSTGGSVQMLSIKSTFDISQINDIRESYDFILESQRDFENQSILKINVISESQILALTTSDILLLNYSLEVIFICPLNIDELTNSIANLPSKTNLSYSIPNFIAAYGRSMFIVDSNFIYRIYSQLWTEKLEKFIVEGKWLECLGLILQNYETNSVESSTDYLSIYLKKYLSLTLSQTTIVSPSNVKFTSNFTLIACVCIEICSSLQRFDFLFDYVYETFKASSQKNVFLVSLVPFILNRKITNLPPDLLIDFIEYCDRHHRLSTAERCLAFMDTTNMDLHSVTHFLLNNKMYSTFLYVYGYGLVDFAGAFQTIFNVLIGSNCKELPKVISSFQAELAYKLLLFLKYAVDGLIFPRKEITTIPSEWLYRLIELIVSKTYAADVPSAITIDNIELDFPYLSILCKVDSFAIFNYLSKSLDILQQSTSLSDQPIRIYNVYRRIQLFLTSSPEGFNEIFYSYCSQAISNCSYYLPIELLDGYIKYLKLKSSIQKTQNVQLFSNDEEKLCLIVKNQLSSVKFIDNLNDIPNYLGEFKLLQETLQSSGYYSASIDLLKYNKMVELFSFCDDAMNFYIELSNNKFLNDKDNGYLVFNFVENMFSYLSKSSFGYSLLNKAIIKHIISLCDLDINKLKNICSRYLMMDYSSVFSALQFNANYQYHVCKELIYAVTKSDLLDINDYLSSNDITNYLKLLIQNQPYEVYTFVNTFENLQLDESIQLCRDTNILDAAAILVEKTGNIDLSLELLVTELDNRLVTIKSYVDELLRSTYKTKSSLINYSTLSESLDDDIKLLHMVLVGSSSARRETISKLSYFKNLEHIIQCMSNLCYRHCDKINTALWFKCFDSILRERNKYSQGVVSSTGEILCLSIGVLMQYMVSSMKDVVSSHEIVKRVTQSYSGSKYVEFKDVIHNMTSSYKFDDWILTSSNSILKNDVNDLLHTKYFEKKRGIRLNNGLANSISDNLTINNFHTKSKIKPEVRSYTNFQYSLMKKRHMLFSLSPPIDAFHLQDIESRRPGSLPYNPKFSNSFETVVEM